MSFRYNVGLQNVGSYQVSGRPWCKHFTTTAGEISHVSFPNVTESLWAHFEENGGGHQVQLAFTDNLRRGLDMSAGTNDHYSTSFTGLSEFSVSFWIKPASASIPRVLEFTGGLPDTRLQGTSSGVLRLLINNVPINSAAGVYDTDTWVHIVVVMIGTTSKVYANGVEVIENTTDIGATPYTGINLGASATNYDDIYDDATLIAKALGPDEVLEIYNSGAHVDLSSLSFSDDLVSHWAFEDNHYREYYSTPDTTSTIYDRISSNNLTFVGTGTPVFTSGRGIDFAFANHKICLTSHTEIHLPFKTKGLLFYSTHNDDFSLFASLTNIPSEKMYDLTGPGIDE